ncbi:MAG: 2Fe-2S iron-sulfur cluster binding domain-containing protein [candidate division Zixibacteria bacterium]|nr:2Fe-2S iron-sulfur cluster binding domain-containing protein [candidate division Zixibacteria bacterium]
MEKRLLHITVNNEIHELYVEPKRLLVEVLRDRLGLTGTKRGCSTGACSACTVLLDGVSVKSCSVLAMQADGAEITTVEGLADGEKLSPLQRSFLDHGAYQCGFCTSGMLMSATALLKESPKPTQDQIIESIHGNICRCTGYNSIIRAIQAVAEGKYKEEG